MLKGWARWAFVVGVGSAIVLLLMLLPRSVLAVLVMIPVVLFVALMIWRIPAEIREDRERRRRFEGE